uniref:Uncharacterized protein n=1 Tax=Anguilla anguilla TaxID=7936 RepID=A0A0E9W644_ANGAN
MSRCFPLFCLYCLYFQNLGTVQKGDYHNSSYSDV